MISVELQGANQLIARVHGIQGRLANPQPALFAAGVVVRDAAVMRIKLQGGDQEWTPSKKTQVQTFTLSRDPYKLGKDGKKHRIRRNGKLLAKDDSVSTGGGGHTGIDTGRLMGSIGVNADDSSADIGTNVQYARWFQEGTGIFAGHSEWTVAASKGKALRWMVGGVPFFARSVTQQGAPARPFLLVTAVERDKVLAIFRKFILGGDAAIPEA